MQMVFWALLMVNLRILRLIWGGTTYLFRITELLSYLATLDEMWASYLSDVGAKLETWRLKIFHNFLFLQSEMVFGILSGFFLNIWCRFQRKIRKVFSKPLISYSRGNKNPVSLHQHRMNNLQMNLLPFFHEKISKMRCSLCHDSESIINPLPDLSCRQSELTDFCTVNTNDIRKYLI